MSGAKITLSRRGKLQVPDNPIIPFIEGDGIGPDIWAAAQKVLDAAVEKAYGGAKKIHWKEVYAGEKANAKKGEWLPKETTDTIAEHLVAIKGPLTTPVGGGFRSLNVAIRQILDLYACVRPVKWYRGVPSPVKKPGLVDMVIYRENTEDIYAGIEYLHGTEENDKMKHFLIDEMGVTGIRFPETASLGVKPVSVEGTERLVRAAIKHAIDNKRKSVTLVHKGNIMSPWQVIDHKGREIIVKDVIADAFLQQILLRPAEYDVIATLNLNGDYVSDALAAIVGGIGIAPGANINYETGIAVFEATHGTAPKYAGQDKVNPSSVILSGVMMLQYMGWKKAGILIEKGIKGAIKKKTVTYDFERLMKNATKLKCSEFGDAIIASM